VGKGRDVGDWAHSCPDVCDGTSAVGESRHRVLAHPLEPCLAPLARAALKGHFDQPPDRLGPAEVLILCGNPVVDRRELPVRRVPAGRRWHVFLRVAASRVVRLRNIHHSQKSQTRLLKPRACHRYRRPLRAKRLKLQDRESCSAGRPEVKKLLLAGIAALALSAPAHAGLSLDFNLFPLSKIFG
jgi:hypothetical protein